MDALVALLLTLHACAGTGGLPDAGCTPGATDPRVTQATIATTICVPGYASSVRPPVRVTSKIKRERMRAYGTVGLPSDVELDHLIPLSLGGAPSAVDNLWPEPWAGEMGARTKDRLENVIRRLVCSGEIPLETAQAEIAADWVAAYRSYVRP